MFFWIHVGIVNQFARSWVFLFGYVMQTLSVLFWVLDWLWHNEQVRHVSSPCLSWEIFLSLWTSFLGLGVLIVIHVGMVIYFARSWGSHLYICWHYEQPRRVLRLLFWIYVGIIGPYSWFWNHCGIMNQFPRSWGSHRDTCWHDELFRLVLGFSSVYVLKLWTSLQNLGYMLAICTSSIGLQD